MEAILDVIKDRVEFVTAVPADEEDIAAVHTKYHIDNVRRMGIYDIARPRGRAGRYRPRPSASKSLASA